MKVNALASVLLMPLLSGIMMVLVGALHSVWSTAPLLGYSASVVIFAVICFLDFWRPRGTPFLLSALLVIATAFPVMLVLGGLHSAWSWIPALGYWQVLIVWAVGIIGGAIVKITILLAFLADYSLLGRN